MVKNTSIRIFDDDIVETRENFTLSIRIQQQYANLGVRQGTPAVATGFIIDDDGMHYIYMYIWCGCVGMCMHVRTISYTR